MLSTERRRANLAPLKLDLGAIKRRSKYSASLPTKAPPLFPSASFHGKAADDGTVSNEFTMGKAAQTGRLFSARTKEVLPVCHNAASSTGFRLHRPTSPQISCWSRKAFIFRIMHLRRHTMGGNHMAIPFWGSADVFCSRATWRKRIVSRQNSRASFPYNASPGFYLFLVCYAPA
jgi:hypothetical protein